MNDICLHIYTYKCQGCGADWTHSEPIMRTADGGYIDLASLTEFNKWFRKGATLTCWQRHTLVVPLCHSCLPTDLPYGYPPQVKDVPHVKRKELSDEALNSLLRS